MFKADHPEQVCNFGTELLEEYVNLNMEKNINIERPSDSDSLNKKSKKKDLKN